MDRFPRECGVALVRTVGVLLLSHPTAEHDRCGLRLSTLQRFCESVQSFRQSRKSKVQSRELVLRSCSTPLFDPEWLSHTFCVPHDMRLCPPAVSSVLKWSGFWLSTGLQCSRPVQICARNHQMLLVQCGGKSKLDGLRAEHGRSLPRSGL